MPIWAAVKRRKSWINNVWVPRWGHSSSWLSHEEAKNPLLGSHLLQQIALLTTAPRSSWKAFPSSQEAVLPWTQTWVLAFLRVWMGEVMAACPCYSKAIATFVCFERSLSPCHFLFGLVESGAEQGHWKWARLSERILPKPCLPLPPRNVKCMWSEWRMFTAERGMGAKILSCRSGLFLAMPMVWNFLVSFKSRGLVVSD